MKFEDKLRILENANELINSIARLMLRPLGSNIEFGSPPLGANLP